MLIGITFLPVREFIRLVFYVAKGDTITRLANENLMIPFTGISFALLVGFILLPALVKLTGGLFRKTKVLLFCFSILAFIGSSYLVEMMAEKQWDIAFVNAEAMNGEQVWGISSSSDDYVGFILNGEYLKVTSVLMTRMADGHFYYLEDGRYVRKNFLTEEFEVYGSLRNFDSGLTHNRTLPIPSLVSSLPRNGLQSGLLSIPIIVKFHYYIFSIIFILIILNFLNNIFDVLNVRSENKNLLPLITQGLALTFCTLAFIFVKPIEYQYLQENYITAKSVVNIIFCIVAVAISGGLFVDNLLKDENKVRYISSIASSVIVIMLYTAEYFMLLGGFYRYGKGFLFNPLPLIGVSVTNIIVVLLPALLVFYILKFIRLKFDTGMQ